MPAGYSGTPLPPKLGGKAGTRYLLVGAPEGYARTLGELPADTTACRPRSRPHPVLPFLRPGSGGPLCAARGKTATGGRAVDLLAKKSSGVPTAITETDVRRIGRATGLVDVKVCAVDEVWSGLKFVRRRKDR